MIKRCEVSVLLRMNDGEDEILKNNSGLSLKISQDFNCP